MYPCYVNTSVINAAGPFSVSPLLYAYWGPQEVKYVDKRTIYKCQELYKPSESTCRILCFNTDHQHETSLYRTTSLNFRWSVTEWESVNILTGKDKLRGRKLSKYLPPLSIEPIFKMKEFAAQETIVSFSSRPLCTGRAVSSYRMENLLSASVSHNICGRPHWCRWQNNASRTFVGHWRWRLLMGRTYFLSLCSVSLADGSL